MLGSKEWINFIEWLSWQVVVFGCSFNNNIIKSVFYHFSPVMLGSAFSACDKASTKVRLDTN